MNPLITIALVYLLGLGLGISLITYKDLDLETIYLFFIWPLVLILLPFYLLGLAIKKLKP